MVQQESINNTESNVLEVKISGEASLIELTTQVTSMCNQAEELSSCLVIFRFAANTDATNWLAQACIQDVNRWERAVRRVERLAAAIISVAEGDIGGPALDLLLTADYRIAPTGFRLCMPINQGYVWPGMAIYRLIHQIGIGHSRQIFIRGISHLTAQKAYSLGIIDQLSDNILDAITEAKSHFSSIAGSNLSMRRQLLLEASTMSYEEVIGSHLAACDRELRRLQNCYQNIHQTEDNV